MCSLVPTSTVLRLHKYIYMHGRRPTEIIHACTAYTCTRMPESLQEAHIYIQIPFVFPIFWVVCQLYSRNLECSFIPCILTRMAWFSRLIKGSVTIKKGPFLFLPKSQIALMISKEDGITKLKCCILPFQAVTAFWASNPECLHRCLFCPSIFRTRFRLVTLLWRQSFPEWEFEKFVWNGMTDFMAQCWLGIRLVWELLHVQIFTRIYYMTTVSNKLRLRHQLFPSFYEYIILYEYK